MRSTPQAKDRWRRVIHAQRVLRGRGVVIRTPIEQLVEQLGARQVLSYSPLANEPVPDFPAQYYPRLFSADGVLPAGIWGEPPLQVVRRGWPAEPLTSAAPTNVDLILVPALAVDLSATRLGKGGGWYDRALRDFHASVFAIVHEDEVLGAGTLPRAAHDVPINGFVTERGSTILNMPTD